MISFSLILFILTLEQKDAKVVVDTPALYHLYKAAGYDHVENFFEAGDDPHHFSLRPSKAKLLNDADQLVYAGQSVIPQLGKAAQNSGEIEIIALDETIADFDPHYWTSPAMMAAIAPEQTAIDFEALREKDLTFPFEIIVDHEAYTPFIEANGITYIGALTDEHDHGAGSHSHHEIEEKLGANVCFISSVAEPNVQFEKIAQDHGAKVVRHDVLGWDIEGEGVAFFEEYYAKLARVFSTCEE